MNDYSIREVIEQAIQTEKLGYIFYSSMAEKFKDNEELNKLFIILAGQELTHEKQFVELEQRLGGEPLENWEEASLYLRAIVESEFFLGNNKSLPSVNMLDTVDAAIQYAINFEKETLLYYLGLQSAIKDNSLLNEIISEEKRHIVRLSDLRKSHSLNN